MNPTLFFIKRSIFKDDKNEYCNIYEFVSKDIDTRLLEEN